MIKSKHIVAAAICQSPKEMFGENLVGMKEENMHCVQPEIIEEPLDRLVVIGHSTYLKCGAKGHPEPTIVWHRDDIPLHTDPRYETLIDGTLVITKFAKTDIGKYQCKAANVIGEAESYRVTIYEDEVSSKVGGQKPTIVLAPHDQYVVPHGEIILHCIAIGKLHFYKRDRLFLFKFFLQSLIFILFVFTGQPEPQISWYFNNEVVKQSHKVHIHTNGTLIVNNTNAKDVGNYKCEVTNTVGTESMIATVQINGEFVFFIFGNTFTFNEFFLLRFNSIRY